MRINCQHFDESISLDEEMCTIVVLENPTVVGNILYSLTEECDDYFSIYDDGFKVIPDKNIIAILNPLSYDFEERKMRTIITNYICNAINDNMTYKDQLEKTFFTLAHNLEKFMNDNSMADFVTPISFDMKDIIKALGINIDLKNVISVYEKIMLILKVLNEMTVDKLVIFVNLSMIVSQEEYCSVVEMVNLHSLKVLMIESTKQFLSDVNYYYMDYDFCMDKISKNMI